MRFYVFYFISQQCTIYEKVMSSEEHLREEHFLWKSSKKIKTFQKTACSAST